MFKKILLGKSRGKRDVNEGNFTKVELSATERALPVDRITQTLDSYKEYLSEKDSSDIYRLIFTINPVCSNILFNSGTEIVYKEGSEECQCLNSAGTIPNDSQIKNYLSYKQSSLPTSYVCSECGQEYDGNGSNGWTCPQCGTYNNGSLIRMLTRSQAIQDTAFSHPEIGKLVYHCGLDIFNNHMLRNREFKVVNKLNSNSIKDGNFNTINDYLRDSNGDIIKEKLVKLSQANTIVSVETNMHLYQYDEIRTFYDAVRDKLVESEGWIGFINPTAMIIPNYVTGNTSISINKCMNNNKTDEFIDMYPDRSLYSFIPKYNTYRNRLEPNWDFFITYPFDSDENHNLVKNGLTCFFYDLDELKDSYFAKSNGNTNFIVHLRTQLKNTLYKGSFISLSFGGAVSTDVPIKVESIGINGDDTQHIFGVNFESLLPYLMEYVNENDGSWRNKIGTITIKLKKNVRGADCKYYIRKFKRLPDFSSSLNPLAFAENIYSDKIAQLVINDDIVTSGLIDNLGRPLSEIFLTIVKRNKGHNEWYKNKNYTGSTIEFSHCFGEVSSGFDMPAGDTNKKYNVHYLTAQNRLNDALENDITDENEWFYGDIVEFSPYTVEETVLEDVYHRFNTMMRETILSEYGTISYDEFVSDDYDVTSTGFLIETKSLLGNSLNSNICDEGYYYKPHYRVKLRAFDEKVRQGSHIKMSFSSVITTNDYITFSGTTSLPYYLSSYTDESGITHGDAILVIDTRDGEVKNAEVISVSGRLGTQIVFKLKEGTEFNISKCNIFKVNTAKPTYAYELNDGTGRYLWRDVLPENKILHGDELYNSMFTNGAHYFHTGINFYLKRQDPSGEYGINLRNNEEHMNADVFTGASEGNFKEISMAEYQNEGENDIC